MFHQFSVEFNAAECSISLPGWRISMPKTIKAEPMTIEAKATASASAKVKRGEKSWSYLYTLLGFALTIETGIVGLVDPLKWPWNLVSLVVVGAVTIYLFLDNGWFQNKLIGIKARYEEKLR
jgi:hypothetical protein